MLSWGARVIELYFPEPSLEDLTPVTKNFVCAEIPNTKLAPSTERIAVLSVTAQDQVGFSLRACPVDHGTGSRSQMLIEATSMVPW